MSNAISYSRYGLWKKCPKRYEYEYILKTPKPEGEQPPGPAARRGLDIHQNIEDYLNGKTDELLVDLRNYVEFFEGLRENECRAEVPYCLNKDWELVEWDHEEGYTRGIVDGLMLDEEEAWVYDWKTGRIYDDHVEQRVLYGIYVMLTQPELKRVTTMMVYVDQQKNHQTVIERAMVDSIKWTWERNFSKMKLAVYPTRPGQHCGWCPYSKEKGGPCKVG